MVDSIWFVVLSISPAIYDYNKSRPYTFKTGIDIQIGSISLHKDREIKYICMNKIVFYYDDSIYIPNFVLALIY